MPARVFRSKILSMWITVAGLVSLLLIAAPAPENIAPLSGGDAPLLQIGSILDAPKAHPLVRVRGTVTYVKREGLPELVIQDRTDGIFISWPRGTSLEVKEGDRVEVEGQPHETYFSPRMHRAVLRSIDRGLPLVAQEVPYVDLLSGRYECRLVKTSGAVRSARIDRTLEPARLLLWIESGAGGFEAWIQQFGEEDGMRFVDGRVEVRGVCLAWSNWRQQPISLRLLVNTLQDVKLIDPPPPTPFDVPPATTRDLLAYKRGGVNIHRVKLQGTVSAVGPGESFVIMTDDHGMRVRGNRGPLKGLQIGDVVEVSGFPEMAGYSAGLGDAVWRVLRSGAAPQPLEAKAATLLNEHVDRRDVDRRLVRVEGTVFSEQPSPGEQGRILDLRDGATNFKAVLPSQERDLVPPIGSRLALTGICELVPHPYPGGKAPDPIGFLLHVRNPGDIQVLDRGPWLTIPQLVGICVAGAFGLTGMLIWNRLLRRTVHHRTQLLATEIRSRHDRDLEFKAILGERERVAAELHDTVQQGLVAASLQMEAAGLALPKTIADGCIHLQLARQYLERCREGLRRSVWDLHATLEASTSLPDELRGLAESMGTAKIRITLSTHGTPCSLRPGTQHEIVRIAGELLSNAVVHSGGAEIKVTLTYAPRLFSLEVRDDGCSFDLETVPGPSTGHFGLAGIRERANRIGASLHFRNLHQEGTTIVLRLPQDDNRRELASSAS